MMKQYRKKPIIVEAIQYDGTNQKEIYVFAKGYAFIKPSGQLVIHTLEGEMLVSISDYVIKGVNGEFYPCKPDIFNKSYDEIKGGIEDVNS